MGARKIGGCFVGIAVFGFVLWGRFHSRSEDSAAIKADAMKLVAEIEGFEANKDLLLQMADRAHGVAFGDAYQIRGRRTAAKFDDDKYIQLFFRSMADQAGQMGRQDLKKAILAIKVGVDEAIAEDAASEAGKAANAHGSAGQAPPKGGAKDERASVIAETPAAAAPHVTRPSAKQKLTQEQLASIADDKLVYEIHDRLLPYVVASGRFGEGHSVATLSKGLRMVYVVCQMEGEVNNGGFSQYFDNTDAKFAVDCVKSLNLIKAKEFSRLMQRAIAAYVRTHPDQQAIKMDKSLKKCLDTYPDTEMEKIDDAFFKCKENLDGLRVQYIRANPDEFVLDESGSGD